MKNKFIILFVVLTASFAFGQNATLSPYSYFGFGQTTNGTTAENAMMGGVTVYADSTQFSLNNPATLKKLDFVQYRVGAAYNSMEQISSNGSATTSTASLNYLALSVPTKHFSFSFGLRPKTNHGYRLRIDGQLEDADTSTFYEGMGGVNSTFLSVAFAPFKGLSLGVTANYNFGLTEKIFTQTTSGIQRGTQVVTRSELSGIQYVFGVHYHKRIMSKYLLQLAATHTTAASLESVNSRAIASINTSANSVLENVDLGSLAKTSNKLASENTIGAGIGLPQKWFVGATYLTTSQGITNPLETNVDVKYVASSKFSVGGFYIPKYDSFTSYLSRVVYRVGAQWEHTGLQLKNQPIKDFGITFGVGLPVSGLSKINIGVAFGQRGTLDAGLIKENYTNIMLGFSLSDIWFIKRKYD